MKLRSSIVKRKPEEINRIKRKVKMERLGEHAKGSNKETVEFKENLKSDRGNSKIRRRHKYRPNRLMRMKLRSYSKIEKNELLDDIKIIRRSKSKTEVTVKSIKKDSIIKPRGEKMIVSEEETKKGLLGKRKMKERTKTNIVLRSATNKMVLRSRSYERIASITQKTINEINKSTIPKVKSTPIIKLIDEFTKSKSKTKEIDSVKRETDRKSVV